MKYIVCQTGNCAQTYPMEYFGVVTKDTKNISCEKCGGVLVDSEGRANFSQHADIRKFITTEDLNKRNKAELKRKRDELKQLQDDIAELEAETY